MCMEACFKQNKPPPPREQVRATTLLSHPTRQIYFTRPTFSHGLKKHALSVSSQALADTDKPDRDKKNSNYFPKRNKSAFALRWTKGCLSPPIVFARKRKRVWFNDVPHVEQHVTFLLLVSDFQSAAHAGPKNMVNQSPCCECKSS